MGLIAVTGAHGFLGQNLRVELQAAHPGKKVVALPRHGHGHVSPRYGLLYLAGGYSPKSKKDFDERQAKAALRSCEEILHSQVDATSRVILVSSTDVLNVVGSGADSTRNRYAGHKLAVEGVCADIAASRGFSLVICRVGPLYGPGESRYTRLIPESIATALSGEPLRFDGPTNFSRRFLYVVDAANVLAQLASTIAHSSPIDLESATLKGWEDIQLAVDSAVERLRQGQLHPQLPSSVSFQTRGGSVILESETPFVAGIGNEVLYEWQRRTDG